MKLQLTFPSSYFCGNEKIQVIKTLRSLFGFSLSEAKAISELSGQTKIYEVKYNENLSSQVSSSFGVKVEIEELIRILRNNDVVVSEVSDSFRKKLKELSVEAIEQDQFQLAIDLINVYRDNF